MNDAKSEKTFNHTVAAISDKISLVSELEHCRRHALRSAVVAAGTEDEMFYLLVAKQARDIRRDFMAEHFPDIDSKLWCLCKTTSALRQIAYEIWEGPAERLAEIDGLVDKVWEKATGVDLSECAACKEDMGKLLDTKAPVV